MWLLNARTHKLKYFSSEDVAPLFAILSHTWGDIEEEIAFHELSSKRIDKKPVSAKIRYCCDQALRDGLEWIWVDTCCIDKRSSAELSEAINSMYRWYSSAKICYAYLVDVPGNTLSNSLPPEFRKSRWFTRGWTLQELIAPSNVVFYSRFWDRLGTKIDQCDLLSEITGIDSTILRDDRDLKCISVAQKMSWAANRETTRVEDMAYCLLGIFDVNIPLLYGEGKKAFIRLQEEIVKSTEDHSIFAWRSFPEHRTFDSFWETIESGAYLYRGLAENDNPDIASSRFLKERPLLKGLLADSPKDFQFSGNIRNLESWSLENSSEAAIRRDSVKIKLPYFIPKTRGGISIFREYFYGSITIVLLDCSPEGDSENYLGIPLLHWNNRIYGNFEDPILIPIGFLTDENTIRGKSVEIAPESRSGRDGIKEHRDILIPQGIVNSTLVLSDVLSVYPSTYNSKLNLLKPGRYVPGNIGTLIYSDGKRRLVIHLGRAISLTTKDRGDDFVYAALSSRWEANHWRANDQRETSHRVSLQELKSQFPFNAWKQLYRGTAFAQTFDDLSLEVSRHDLPPLRNDYFDELTI